MVKRYSKYRIGWYLGRHAEAGNGELVEEPFVRAAVEHAELTALRMALYQATGDPEVAAMALEQALVRGGQGTLPIVAPAHQERLKDLAVRYLMTDAAAHMHAVPPDDEIDRLIRMAENKDVPAELLVMRRGLLCFEQFPRLAAWTNGRPQLPQGFTVVIVGAGFSGLAMAVQLGQLGIPYTIVERRDEVGGVWSINTYPDARVDTLTATYQYGFEKKYPWSEYFARQGEVRQYMEHVATKHRVMEHIRFGHDVTGAAFDEAAGRWALEVNAGGVPIAMYANVIVSAAGLFATPKKLDVEGADDFAGDLVHTTNWGTDRSVAGKTVAVIGNGSTGVQLLAPVAEEADQVYVFQRTPQWISPRERYGQVMSDEARWLLEAMPYYWNWSRYVAVMPLMDAHELLEPDPEWIAKGGLVNERSDRVREVLVGYIKAQVGDRPDLVEKLIPQYAPIARRPVVDNNWYKALIRPDVELVTTPIRRITKAGVETVDCTEYQVDLIIAAVGFETSRYLWPCDYRGRGGVHLADVWKSAGAQAYLGMTVPGFPNFFMLYGPNSQPISGGSTLPNWYETWSKYIASAIITLIENDLTTIEVRPDRYADYNERLQEAASRLIYITDEASRDANYYVNEFGRLQVNFPWEAEEFFALSSEPNLDDFLLG